MLSDRDRTNELGGNFVRDWFQVTLIDIVKRNISFSFTTANSNSEEWYEDLIRIPDFITGAIASFDFDNIGKHRLNLPVSRESERIWPITKAIASIIGFILTTTA